MLIEFLLVGLIALAPPCDVALELELPRDRFDRLSVSAILRNEGNVFVRLVTPGDGSDGGRRTPKVEWEVRNERGDRMISDLIGVSCGNINSLDPGESFVLLPGATRRLNAGWLRRPSVPKSGTYRVRLHYENIPDMEWGGVPLGPHDPSEMKLVRTSTECTIVSNWVEVSSP